MRSASETPYAMLTPSGFSHEIVTSGSAMALGESAIARTAPRTSGLKSICSLHGQARRLAHFTRRLVERSIFRVAPVEPCKPRWTLSSMQVRRGIPCGCLGVYSNLLSENSVRLDNGVDGHERRQCRDCRSNDDPKGADCRARLQSGVGDHRRRMYLMARLGERGHNAMVAQAIRNGR